MEIRFTSAVNTLQVPAIRFHFEESKNGTEALCCQYSSIHLCASVYLSKNITVHSVLRNTLRDTQNLPFIFSRLRSITACHLCLNGLSKAVIDRHRILHMEWASGISRCACRYQYVFPVVDLCKACKTQTRLAGISCLAAQDLAAGNGRVRKILNMVL